MILGISVQDAGIIEREAPAKPFLRWAGGKTQLLPELLKRTPENFNHYFEPFLGGGAFFFALCETFRKPLDATLVDSNELLIHTFQQVKDNSQWLLSELKYFNGVTVTKELYYQEREKFNAPHRSSHTHDMHPAQRAARFIFLNKTCFNGLYRENSKKLFNVPYGYLKNPSIYNEDTILACSEALKNATILADDYSVIFETAKRGDFVYFDPPYVPVDCDSFTNYTSEGFGVDDHLKLLGLCKALNTEGVKFMLSNSSAPIVFEMFQEFNIETVQARRNINRNGKGRGAVNEVVIRNYK